MIIDLFHLHWTVKDAAWKLIYMTEERDIFKAAMWKQVLNELDIPKITSQIDMTNDEVIRLIKRYALKLQEERKLYEGATIHLREPEGMGAAL